jgi:DNA-binding transcriptional ArsR family regulator
MQGHRKTAEIFKALAHPTRLQIMELLRDEEACVCHMESLLGQRQAYISQQLARLREAGLVVDRREGLNVFYALADPAIGDLLDAAYRAAGVVAGQAGETLDFELPPHTGPCPCPRCAEKEGRALEDKANAGMTHGR